VNAAAAVLLGATALLAVGDWFAVGTGWRRLEMLTKPATMAALLAAALVLTPLDPTRRGLFAIALAFSLAGDLALLGQDRVRWFAIGLGAFLVAHVAYTLGMVGSQQSPTGLVSGAVFAALAASYVGRCIVLGAAEHRGWPLGVAVAVYMGVISVMLAVAAGTGRALAISGAGLFYASDGVLGWNRFVTPLPAGRLLTRVLYHAGQVLLVLSLVA
jgi:alkenylglycerophosphocholine/alkenylglycerophosphoethanolamine hydrolase